MLKFTLKYLIFGPLEPSSGSCTQYTQHNLKYMLPQHCKTYNDVFLMVNITKV